MIIPELPAYLTTLGGAEYKGLIISLFTITAMVSRPFSGKLADKIGRIPVMIFGALVCFICSLIYPIISTLAGFFILRILHGFSTGFTPTGGAAYLSDIIPSDRRGEAMGLLGTAGAIGMAGGPALGGLLANQFGLSVMFYCSSFFAFVAIIILFTIRETLLEKEGFSFQHLKIGKGDVFEPLVLAPCLVMVLSVFAYGAVFTLIPDFGQHVGIRNKGLLFTLITIGSLLVRLLAGKASDRYGRVAVLRVSVVMMGMSMFAISVSETATQLMFSVSLYGLAHGCTSPTLLAWVADLSDDRYKGRAIASLYIFMELGIGLGAFISGWVYGNDPSQFVVVFSVCGLLCVTAFLYLIIQPRLLKTAS